MKNLKDSALHTTEGSEKRKKKMLIELAAEALKFEMKHQEPIGKTYRRKRPTK